MKYFKKNHLPTSITYNGKQYDRDSDLSPFATLNVSEDTLIARAARDNKKIVIVSVLAKNLKGKLNTHNKPYQPTMWVFSHKEV